MILIKIRKKISVRKRNRILLDREVGIDLYCEEDLLNQIQFTLEHYQSLYSSFLIIYIDVYRAK